MMKQITAQEALQAHIQGKSVLLLGTEWNDSDEASCAIGGSLSRKTTTFRVKFLIINFSFAWMGKELDSTSCDFNKTHKHF